VRNVAAKRIRAGEVLAGQPARMGFTGRPQFSIAPSCLHNRPGSSEP
jgi:hypothetical protein